MSQEPPGTRPSRQVRHQLAAAVLDGDAPLPVPGLPTPAEPASIPASADLIAPVNAAPKTPATA